MQIPYGYLDYAHGPAAEAGFAPALRLFGLPLRKRRVEVNLSDQELREELYQVAELYADGKGEDFPKRHINTARKILLEISQQEKKG